MTPTETLLYEALLEAGNECRKIHSVLPDNLEPMLKDWIAGVANRIDAALEKVPSKAP